MPNPSTQTWRRLTVVTILAAMAFLVAHVVWLEDGQLTHHVGLLFFVALMLLLSLWFAWVGLGTAEQKRAKQEAQLQNYTQRLAILGEVANLLNASLDPQVVLTTLLDQLGRLVQSDSVSLLYLTADELELVAYKHADLPTWQFGSQKVPTTGIEQVMLDTHQPVLVADTRRHHLWDGRLHARPIGSWLGTPMLVSDEVVGFINLSKREYGFFTSQDLEIVETFASQAATAVHNARLFAQAQHELAERERVERALYASEQKFRTLFETMSQGVIFRNGEGLTAINPAVEEITGLTLAELEAEYSGRVQWLIMDETGAPIALEEAPTSLALRTGQATHDKLVRYYNPRKQRDCWVLVDAVPLFEEGEALPTAVYAILKDVTESKEYERALRESEARFRTLFETISHGVVYYEADGRVVAANPAAYAILGDVTAQNDRDSIAFSPDWRILGEDGTALENYADLVQIAFGSGQPLHNLVIGIQRHAREAVHWLQIEVVPMFREGDAKPYQVYTVFQDITAKKQAEEALRQTQKLESLGILAGGIAHDFNNLLVALLGQSSLALQKLGEAHPVTKHIEKVVQAAEHAAGLTRQMLAFSGRGQFEIKRLNLNQIVQENVPLLQVAIPKAVQLTTHLAADLPLVEADPSQMQQVVMNLVLNGAEAADQEGGWVTLTTAVQRVEPTTAPQWQLPNAPLPAGDYVRLEVEDNGTGIQPAQLAQIFDPFFTTKVTGRGLGLAAVLGIIRGHRGGLRVQSTVGQGTIFTLLFPVVATAEYAPPPPPPAHSPSQPTAVRALVIDDELGVRYVLQDIIESVGGRVWLAENGREGLTLYEQQQAQFDLVILDLSMPGLSGMDTLVRLRQLNPQVRVLLSSGYSQGEVWPDLELSEGVSFVQKPYRADELLAAVYQLLAT